MKRGLTNIGFDIGPAKKVIGWWCMDSVKIAIR
jgi:hypothetical protein